MPKITITSTAIDAGFIAKRGPNAFAVLTVIIRHKNDNEESWPSIPTIMKKTGLGEKSVRAAIKVLKSEKDIERDNPKRGKRGSRVINRVLTKAMGCYKKVVTEKCQVDKKVLAGFYQLLSKYLPKSTWRKVVGTFRQPHHEVIESIEVIVKEVITSTTEKFEKEVEKLQQENNRLIEIKNSLQQKIESLEDESGEVKAQAKADSLNEELRRHFDANMSSWCDSIIFDQLFQEDLARKYKVGSSEVVELLSSFISQKRALGEDTWGSFNAFKKNFYFWIPKNRNNGKSNYQRNVSSAPPQTRIITEQAHREAFAQTIAEMGY